MLHVCVHQVSVYGCRVCDAAWSSLPVIDRGLADIYVVGAQYDAVACQVIVRADGIYMHAGLVGYQVALYVDLLEGSEHPGPTGCTTLEVGEDMACVFVQEIEVAASCPDVQLNAVARLVSRRDGSLHRCLVVGSRVAYVSVQEDASLAVSPVSVNVHLAHLASVEGEVADVKEGICLRFAL